MNKSPYLGNMRYKIYKIQEGAKHIIKVSFKFVKAILSYCPNMLKAEEGIRQTDNIIPYYFL